MRRRSYDIVFTLALFALYSTIAFSLGALGSHIYQDTTATMSANYDRRTSVHYVAQKIRQSDVASASLRVEQLGDGDALVLTRLYSGAPYSTWLYVSQGNLYEVLMAADQRPETNYGQAIMPMTEMSIEVTDANTGLIGISFVLQNGQTADLHIYLRSIHVEEKQ